MRQNDKGITYGITYVNCQTKCVFNGSRLGKQYSANAIQQRCDAEQQMPIKKQQVGQTTFEHEKQKVQSASFGISKIFDELIQPEQNQFATEPPEQRKFKKRKRKQRPSHN